ncbi:MAG: 30S ribosomal protein S4 [Nanoarchaeota archaeon]|nr:30S ribosomal protein S4 [Nanoarchaeota archaeon]
MTWIRKKKRYSRPRKLFDKLRIDEEKELKKQYGLKNKKELWKAEASIERIRNQAKNLVTASKEKQDILFNKLNKMGFKVEKTADVLDLKKEDWLKRRLQSMIVSKKLAKLKEARQLIAHKHVTINGSIVNVPSYVVNVDEEDKIKVNKPQIKKIIEKKELKLKENKND